VRGRCIAARAAAIAPTAGIDGVPDRVAELRERLNAVERRTRPPSPAVGGDTGPSMNDPATAAPPASPIDYVGFERRFRGDPDRVQQITRERYLELLRDNGPVLDVGCGKGELVGALKEAGVAAVGIDLDPAMVDEAKAQGLDVHVADLNAFLENQPPGSYGAIISTQVVEHLQVADLVRFLELSASRLVGGGVFIAETPNPTSLIVLGTHFILDPTHVRPIHPALMAYLCECAGFRSVELRYYEPASQYHLSMVDERGAPQWAKKLNANFTRINEVLFGPQDYAVVAHTAP
jgi:2-polyprenyl-3-methyl-5-hydroxy-6-metoxy-1,4-benzoquinol methylase